MWIAHFLHLLGRSWDNLLKASGTTTLGFLLWTVTFTVVSWGVTIAPKWYELHQGKDPLALRKAVAASWWPAGALLAGGILAVVLLSYLISVVNTIYNDHQSLASQVAELRETNRHLEGTLHKKTHSLDTSDPVFPNFIYLLQAFHVFRNTNNGAPCVLRVTAPPESRALASVVAQFSNSVSGCYTFGPEDTGADPDLDKVAAAGMVPAMIVLHAARDDKAADQLLGNLGTYIQTRRSYDLPNEIGNYKLKDADEGKERLIWLQFGPNVKWNSELDAERK